MSYRIAPRLPLTFEMQRIASGEIDDALGHPAVATDNPDKALHACRKRAKSGTIEPGRNVVEVRSGDMHKGQALRTFVAEQEATGVVFGGDDLGDVEAFEAVRALRADGLPGLVVCSASHQQPDLVELADVVVDGPTGVVELLGHLASPVRS